LSMWLASRSYRARLNIREKLNAWESIE
jgi:hypothetical protein